MITAFDIDRGYRETDELAALAEQLDIVERDRDFYREDYKHVCAERDRLQQELADLRKTAPGTVTGWTCTTRDAWEAWRADRTDRNYHQFTMDYLRDKAIVAGKP